MCFKRNLVIDFMEETLIYQVKKKIRIMEKNEVAGFVAFFTVDFHGLFQVRLGKC